MASDTTTIHFLGTRGSVPVSGDAFLKYGGNTTSIRISSPVISDLLLFDCGSGMVGLGNEIESAGIPVFGNIFLTHPHLDHLLGIPFFKPFYNPKNMFRIYMPDQHDAGCREVISRVMTPPFFPVTPDAFGSATDFVTSDDHMLFHGEGFTVESAPVCHPGETVMYKITIAGKTIVFCPDNELAMASPGLRENMLNFIKNADVLIHDGQESVESYSFVKGRGHTAWEEATEFAIEANVKQLAIVHHSPDSDDKTLESREKTAAAKFGKKLNVLFARDGQNLTV